MDFGLDLSDRFYNKKVQSISIFLKEWANLNLLNLVPQKSDMWIVA